MRTFFCPKTGRGLEFGECRRVGRRLISPYAEVDVQISGWCLLCIGGGLGLASSMIVSMIINLLGAAAGTAFGVVGLMRLARQFRAHRRGRGLDRDTDTAS